MKNIVLTGIMILVIVGIMGIVAATMTVLNEKDDIKQYNVEIQVTKGWNLIASGFIFASDLNYLDETGDIKKENIKAVYVYADKINEYISSYPKYDERLYSANNYFKGNEQEIIGRANWIYVDKSGILKYKTKAIKTIDATKLYGGWNFISITPEYLGKELKDVKGTCNLEKVWVWEGEHQQWINLIEDPGFYSGSEGAGMIIKVTNDCEFGSGMPGLPQIPIDDVNSLCSDSDSGLNYNVQGTVRGYNEDAPVREITTASDTCSGNTLHEWICKNSEEYDDESYICPNGCSNGACVTTSQVCSDSDGGLNYNVKGTVSGYNEDAPVREISNVSDSCSGNTLHEWICKTSEEYDDESYNCPNGCNDGVCI